MESPKYLFELELLFQKMVQADPPLNHILSHFIKYVEGAYTLFLE